MKTIYVASLGLLLIAFSNAYAGENVGPCFCTCSSGKQVLFSAGDEAHDYLTQSYELGVMPVSACAGRVGRGCHGRLQPQSLEVTSGTHTVCKVPKALQTGNLVSAL